MTPARSTKRPAGFPSTLLLLALALVWAAPPAAASPEPTLEAPADGAVAAPPVTFLVDLPDEGWVRVQIATGETFDAGSLACDSGWYHSGFHTTSWWTLPGVIGNSEVDCDPTPGVYRWRAAFGGPTGATPSDADAAWSAPSTFTIPAAPPPAPPPPPPDQAPDEYDDEEAAICESGDDDPDGSDPGAVEFSADDVEPTPEELAIGTPPPATQETFGSLASVLDDVETEEEEEELDTSGATACQKPDIFRWVAVSEFHVALGFDGIFHYEDGRETKTQVALQMPSGTWTVGGWMTEATTRGARWHWPRKGPFHRRIAAEYRYRKHARCTKGGCHMWWAPYRWTGRLRPGAIRVQTTGWNNRYKFRLPHGHSWTKWFGTNKTMEKAVSISGVSLNAQAGYSSITRMTWKSTPRCRDNWIDPVNTDATAAKLIYTWSDNC